MLDLWGKSIGLPVTGYSLVYTEAKENLNVEYIETEPPLSWKIQQNW